MGGVTDLDDLRSAVRTHGWVVASSPADGARPDTTSTVGLTARGLAELVVLGLPDDVGGALLNELAARIVDGAPTDDGVPLPDLLDGAAAPVLLTVDGAVAGVPACEVYDEVRLRQLVWPDADGRFPWHPGFAHPDLQPLMADPPPTPAPHVDAAPPAEWPLDDDPHRAVLTSRHVAESGSVVLMVVHTEEGELRFLDGASDFDPTAAVAECLHDALARDLTLAEAVRPLQPGRVAERDGQDDAWRFDDW
jgi:hypothetical protein